MKIRSVLLFSAVLAAAMPLAASHAAPLGTVRLAQTPDTFTLDNGTVTAVIRKRGGTLSSLTYRGLEMLDPSPRHTGGYWSHEPGGTQVSSAVTIDPAANGGERGEVAARGISGGQPVGSGPGGSVIADIEIRYSLGRSDSGIYTYTILHHAPDYPPTSLGEARFCAKLNDGIFDWMTVDANRNQEAITAYDWDHGTVMNMKEARLMNTGLYKGHVEHKYDFSALQFDNPALGWSSTKQHVGIWFVNPTIEYLSGGPTKVELCVHRDATFGTDLNAPAPPCLLNYWRGSHYGGSSCDVAAGEDWTKVVGPFLIYCNAGPTPDAMWKDALAAAGRESHAWPYGWVQGVDYPHRDQRGTVSGVIRLQDPQAKDGRLDHLLVGLTAPDYTTGRGRTTVGWQLDAKHYEFWVRGGDDGHFTIPNVRPGLYTLHAISNSVLGDFAKTDVHVSAGQPLDLGQLDWKPVRYGRQLWEIGTPDRTAAEFRHGDHYWQWGLYLQYPQDFPNDVNFVIGKSQERTDWNYAQCPRPDRPNGTPWTITFQLPNQPKGRATLRLAFAATSARHVDVSVNQQPAGTVGPLTDTATIRRDGIRGLWYERDVPFSAALLKPGTNTITLTVPPGNPMMGVEYDYLRLELDETAAPAAA